MAWTPPRAAAVLSLLLLGACAGGDAAEQAADSAAGAPAAAEPAAPSDPAALSARGVAGYYDLGDYVVMGEVVNASDAPAYAVELEVEYRDAAGEVLTTDEAAPALVRVEPGGTAPFLDTRYAAPEGIARATARVTRGSPKGSPEYHPLAITGTSARKGITGVVVTGRGRNDSGRPLSSVKLVASFRDAAGVVTGIYFDYPVIGVLRPGQEFDFTIETMDDSVAGHAVLVQGEGRVGG